MAAAIQKLHDDFLSCNICTELYQDPCTLACGHTFCRRCLATFNKTQPDAIKAKSFLCPNCRQMTKVPNPGSSVDDWVKQIKPSFLIVGLLDSFASQSEGDTSAENLCFSCKQSNENTPASSHCIDCDISICSRCAKGHSAMPVTSHHVITDLGEEVKVMRKRKIICKAHNSIIEFCCKDCNKAVCHKCCILDHRKCDNVITIESMVPAMKFVLREKKQMMTQAVKKSKLTYKTNEDSILDINRRSAQTASDIKALTEKAISVLKLKSKQLEDQLENIREKQIGDLKGQMKSDEIDIQMYQQHYEFIDQVLTTESEMDMYDMYQLCQSGAITTVSGTNTLLRDTTLGQITFVKELDLQTFDRSIQLGKIIVVKEEFDLSCTPTLTDTIDIRLKDEDTPDPVDIIVMDDGGSEIAVVTVWNFSCIRSFYTEKNQGRNCSLKLNARPWGLTKINKSKVAVASTNTISIVEVTPQLVLLSQSKTKKNYRCITFVSDSTLAASGSVSFTVDIIDMAGNVKRSITTETHLIVSPFLLSSTNDGNILAADTGSNVVYCLTPEGQVVFKYQPPEGKGSISPRGVLSTPTGDVLVSDYYGRVIHLTGKGNFVRELLTSKDGIENPYGVYLHKSKLFVVHYRKPISVFGFKKT